MTQISELLQQLGFRSTYVGFSYLVDAVALALEDESYLLCLFKRLYPDIALRYQTTGACVERALRTVIAAFWSKGNRALLEEITGYPLAQKPTAGELVDILSWYFRRQAAV